MQIGSESADLKSRSSDTMLNSIGEHECLVEGPLNHLKQSMVQFQKPKKIYNERRLYYGGGTGIVPNDTFGYVGLSPNSDRRGPLSRGSPIFGWNLGPNKSKDDDICAMGKEKMRVVTRMLLLPSKSENNLLSKRLATGPLDAPYEALIMPYQDCKALAFSILIYPQN